MLEYALLYQAGVSVITGEIGCGKTTLVRHLLDQHGDDVTLGLLSNTHEASEDLLGWVLLAFGIDYSGTKVEKFERFQNFLINEYANGNRIVLIIDEAQNLGLKVLEELRLLTNINSGKDLLLQIVLVGQPQLKTLLQKPSLVQFAQRVAADFHIQPLVEEDVEDYIAARLKIAGRDTPLFTKEAITPIFQYTKGIPRLINLLCDMCLVYGLVEDADLVTDDIVETVLRDKRDYGVFDTDSQKTAPTGDEDKRFEVNAPGEGPALVIHDHALAKRLISNKEPSG
ncbi:MAG: AAA family ATPase [Pseudomonadota bacterium]